MHESDIPRPAVTVAAVVAEGDRYLVVEEVTRAGLRLNQPAGHLEAGEAIAAAAARETLEETGYRVRPTALVGIYRWESPDTGITFIRFAFAADVLAHEPERPLDEGIVRALWLSHAEIVAQRERHRSPLVLRCLDDFRAGRRLPLDIVSEIG
jgi:8-oxo-dGTP pyrophosphatase MutT (NUDIX family)